MVSQTSCCPSSCTCVHGFAMVLSCMLAPVCYQYFTVLHFYFALPCMLSAGHSVKSTLVHASRCCHACLQQSPGWRSGFGVTCDEHKVCGEGANATAPNGPCYCCSLELQVCRCSFANHPLYCSVQRCVMQPRLGFLKCSVALYLSALSDIVWTATPGNWTCNKLQSASCSE